MAFCVFYYFGLHNYESPSFYVLNDEDELAKETLSKIYPDEDEVGQVSYEISNRQM